MKQRKKNDSTNLHPMFHRVHLVGDNLPVLEGPVLHTKELASRPIGTRFAYRFLFFKYAILLTGEGDRIERSGQPIAVQGASCGHGSQNGGRNSLGDTFFKVRCGIRCNSLGFGLLVSDCFYCVTREMSPPAPSRACPHAERLIFCGRYTHIG